MISVLVVDDDSSKRERAIALLEDSLGASNLRHASAISASAAVHMLESDEFDLLILDLNLPIREDEPPTPEGGIKLLRQIVRAGVRLRRPRYILGLTAYANLAGTFAAEFRAETWQVVKYDAQTTAWQESIRNLATHILETKLSRGGLCYDQDLAIVCALQSVELEAVLSLPANWEITRIHGDDTIYHRGTFANDKHSVHVVAAAAVEMGTAAAACLTMKTIVAFRPRYVAHCGIAAGTTGAFGDILIADQSWDYGAGKIKATDSDQSLFSPAPNYIPIDAELKEKLQYFKTHRRDILDRIRSSAPMGAPQQALQAHLGPVATGAAVVEDEEVIRSIMRLNRKVVGVEMETYGVYLACRTAAEPKPKCFAAKSVCDFGKPPKTDEYQRYAAYTSARFTYEFALAHLAS